MTCRVRGKQLMNIPFINLLDGRLAPTEFMRIWAEGKERENY